jgi:hypothetical protein
MGGPIAWGLGVGLTTPHCKKISLLQNVTQGRRPGWILLHKQPKLRKMDMRFGTWNVRSMYRAGSLVTVVNEVSKYKLDLVEVQEVRWDRWHQTSR